MVCLPSGFDPNKLGLRGRFRTPCWVSQPLYAGLFKPDATCLRATGGGDQVDGALHSAHVPRTRLDALSSSFTSLRTTPRRPDLHQRSCSMHVTLVACRGWCRVTGAVK